MVLFHVAYDLEDIFGLTAFATARPPWNLVGDLAAAAFFFVFGLSAVPAAQKYASRFWRQSIRRSGVLLFWGMTVTVVSLLFLPQMPIWFGVLHFLAVAALLLPLFDKWRIKWLILAALLSITLGFVFAGLRVDHAFLLPLGVRPPGFASADYYPLFPFVAAVIAGVAAGKTVYRQKKQRPSLNKILPLPLEAFAFAGRHALTIYLVHQPIIYGFLVLMKAAFT
jgi:uncharacterized membrane protein